MKQNRKVNNLSLNKTTVTKLQKTELKDIKGGVQATYYDQLIFTGGTIGETCGYACGDCMSITIRTFAANTL